MAPPRRKPKARFEGRVIDPPYSYRRRRKHLDIPHRPEACGHISELIHELLNITERARAVQRRNYRSRRCCDMRKYRSVREVASDTSDSRESTDSAEESEYMTESVVTSNEDLTEAMDTANSSAVTGSESSSVSSVSVEPITLSDSIDTTRKYLKKKSFVQLINNCIRSGIEEGKRQAKEYLRKALSFGVKAGYLIPADPQGKVIRVLPDLNDRKGQENESRGRRREPRKDVQRSRQVVPVWSRKRKLRDSSVEELTPRKKQRPAPRTRGGKLNSKKVKPTTRTANASHRGKPVERIVLTKKKAKENIGKKAAGSRGKYEGEDPKKRSTRRYTRTSAESKNEKDNRNENHLDRGDGDQDKVESGGNETNQRIPPEQRKSVQNQVCSSKILDEASQGNGGEGNGEEKSEELDFEKDENEQIRIGA